MDLTRDQQLAMHRSMVRIRLFEETAGKLMETGRMPGFLHLYVGQEAVAVGVCEALRVDDYISSTHRGHGHLLAKGGDVAKMMAELMGKATGYCGGKGGSMHINDLSLGMLGANGVVGAGVPIAVGAGFRNMYLGTDQVSVAFFGDAATNIGAFHEAANMACALQLPVIFVCEHNMYGEYTPTKKVMVIADVVDRAPGYGMPGVIVDGMDVLAVHGATVEAVARARGGEGPTLIEAKTYRFYNHHGIQNLGLKYRPDDEVIAWKARDPITSFEQWLIEGGVANREDLDAVWAELRATIGAAVEFAEQSPFPDESQLLAGVYTGSGE
ncbi:MAG TPA: thiamine pyrophosphate-dependent dehydrogenase E1 component subunit alpha [Acidimicrobiales bacterium]|jgi:pyruvate dehydrogenase E1 component alpha subunit|nr:thiamine pyrophosphate-dependent dehydrogenase E1 component subunit alpha [Acidimicrobiales bacterium]